ncbi:MAG: indole-3-glycerol phosphate synthase TrpC [Phascolarctobacterium sp.]|nr:indole-3-glycerol phosphate synthase TrpC [Phascolarctobacterium sp.]
MILDDIAAYTRLRVESLKKQKSLYAVRDEAEGRPAGKDFQAALAAPGLSVIAELKQASPSKGLIAPNFERIYLDKARQYEEGGAAAISCLTEPKFFLGSDEYLRQVRAAVQLPILRKDFTVDEYQIYEAKCLGADAVLLICSLLSQGQLAEYLCQAHELGLSALVEAHDADEVGSALAAGAAIIGVNNRNLKDFSVNPLNSLRLREQIPAEKLFVAESGIAKASDCAGLKAAGVQAVLVGEALMRSPNPAAMIKEMRA